MSLSEHAPDVFVVDVQPDRERVVVRPCGELDLSTVGAVERELGDLREAGFDHLVVDLESLDFLDSSGLEMLLRWTRIAEQEDLTFEVLPGGPAVMRVADLAGVLPVLPMVRRGRFDRGL